MGDTHADTPEVEQEKGLEDMAERGRAMEGRGPSPGQGQLLLWT